MATAPKKRKKFLCIGLSIIAAALLASWPEVRPLVAPLIAECAQ